MFSAAMTDHGLDDPSCRPSLCTNLSALFVMLRAMLAMGLGATDASCLKLIQTLSILITGTTNEVDPVTNISRMLNRMSSRIGSCTIRIDLQETSSSTTWRVVSGRIDWPSGWV